MINLRDGTTETKATTIGLFTVNKSFSVLTNKIKQLLQIKDRHNNSCFYIHDSTASGLPEKPGKGVHLYVA